MVQNLLAAAVTNPMNTIALVLVPVGGLMLTIVIVGIALANMMRGIRREMVELRKEVRQEMAGLKTELRQEMAELKTELRQEMAEIRRRLDDMDRRLGSVDRRLARVEGALASHGPLPLHAPAAKPSQSPG